MLNQASPALVKPWRGNGEVMNILHTGRLSIYLTNTVMSVMASIRKTELTIQSLDILNSAENGRLQIQNQA
jgi:hypothetical protein